jgi:hypothetical protein
MFNIRSLPPDFGGGGDKGKTGLRAKAANAWGFVVLSYFDIWQPVPKIPVRR